MLESGEETVVGEEGIPEMLPETVIEPEPTSA
jgi:hypothetical protein